MTMPTREEFGALVQAANNGDAKAQGRLRSVLEENPVIWQQVGDLAQHAERALLMLVAGPDQLARESTARKLQELRDDLSGTNPTALERLAVDRIVALHLQLQYVDTLFAGSLESSPKHRNQVVRWQDQVNRRYNLAVKSLLDIRRLSPSTAKPLEAISSRPELRVFGAGVDTTPKSATGT